MIPLAVFGDPIAHSLSPRLHTIFAQQAGLAVDYQAILSPADSFADQVKSFFAAGGRGANVTLPHKERALLLADNITFAASYAGAANTLWLDGSNLHADNTDGAGLVLDLSRVWGSLSGMRILVLGAGGAARGIIGPLLAAGARQITIKNRTLNRAEQLVAKAADPRVILYDDEATYPPFDAVINASAAGHNTQANDLVSEWFSHNTRAYDLSYGPAAQPFLQGAGLYSASVHDGLGMLVGQGLISFQRWTGIDLDFTFALQSFADSLANPTDK